MKLLLQHIQLKKRRYAQLPFFDFLRDDSCSASARLSFLPCMAPFILTFADLNKYVLRVEPTQDPYQRMINDHTYEDDHHWPWFLEDYAKLGHDLAPQAPSETMRDLWSDATAANRMLSHHLAHLIWSSETVVRLAILEAIEETGQVLFSLTTELAESIRRETGVHLRYCGAFHFDRETGHTMSGDHALLAQIKLTAVQRQDAFHRVDAVFHLFAQWTQELLRFAQAQIEADTSLDRGVLTIRREVLRPVTAG